jgi:hypothetical protein
LYAIEELKRAKAKIIGVLLNQAKVTNGDYYHYKFNRRYNRDLYRSDHAIGDGGS